MRKQAAKTETRKNDQPVSQQVPWLRGLLRLSLAVSSIQDQDSILEELAHQAMEATGAACAFIWLEEDTGWESPPKVARCKPSLSPVETLAIMKARVPQVARESKQATLVTANPHPSLTPYKHAAHNGSAPLAIHKDKETPREALTVPLVAANRILGMMCLLADAPSREFTGDQFEAASVMAAQVAMSLEGARLFGRVQQGKKEWEATFDAIGDAVLLISPDGKLLRVNQAAARDSGMHFRELVGQPCWQVMHACETPPADCPLQQVLQTRRPASAEMMDQEGQRIVSVSVYPMFDARGEIQAVVEHARDVTQIKQAQARLMQAEKLSALGELTAGVAHELNNPLTSILGFIQLLQRTELPERQSGYLATIHSESKRAAKIVRNLLTFARRQEPEKKMLSVNAVLEETLTLIGYQLRVSGVRVETDLDPGLPQTAADPYQLQQVFVNIINNAQQAMAEVHGGGTLLIHTSEVLRPAGYAHDSTLGAQNAPDMTMEGWVRLEFTDDGPGIAPELLPRIFDPFFTTKSLGKGTGLGLSVCHGIVRDHDGHIWAESAPGRGAKFLVELPVRTVRKAEARAAAEKVPELPPGQMLVVDDEESSLHLLKEVLREHAQQVDVSHDGADALDKMSRKRYDVILCDVRMPGLDGEDVYSIMKQRWPDMVERLVFLTGDMASPRTRAFLQRTARPVVEKPFDVADLIRVIREVYRSGE